MFDLTCLIWLVCARVADGKFACKLPSSAPPYTASAAAVHTAWQGTLLRTVPLFPSHACVLAAAFSTPYSVPDPGSPVDKHDPTPPVATRHTPHGSKLHQNPKRVYRQPSQHLHIRPRKLQVSFIAEILCTGL